MNYPCHPPRVFGGDCFDAYRILGAHPAQGPHGEEGWRFAVWAPGATAVEVCGGFDGWGARRAHGKSRYRRVERLRPRPCRGRAVQIPRPWADGSAVMRSDPYAFATELRPGTASRLTKLDFHL